MGRVGEDTRFKQRGEQRDGVVVENDDGNALCDGLIEELKRRRNGRRRTREEEEVCFLCGTVVGQRRRNRHRLVVEYKSSTVTTLTGTRI